MRYTKLECRRRGSGVLRMPSVRLGGSLRAFQPGKSRCYQGW